MARPEDYHKIPAPDSSAAGRFHPEPNNSPLGRLARLWRPIGAGIDEILGATMARFAMRLVDAAGKAYTVDEIVALGKTGSLSAPSMVPISFTTGPVDTQVAGTPTTLNNSIFCRQPLFTTPAFGITRLSAKFANYAVSNTGTFGNGGTAMPIPTVILRVSLEYPAGNFIPLFLKGDRDIVIKPGGLIETDPIEIKIPANTQYWIRTLLVAETGNRLAGIAKNFYNNSAEGKLALGVTGKAALATLTVTSGEITRVNLEESGSGYPPNTKVTCTFGAVGSGTGASIVANIGKAGLVDDFTILARGTSYSVSTTIAIPGNATGTIVNNAIPTDLTLQTGGEATTTFTGYGTISVSGLPDDNAVHRSFIAVGDSITEGVWDSSVNFRAWPYRVFNAYGTPIINIGDSGLSAFLGFAPNSRCWMTFQPTTNYTNAIVALGANDLNNSRTSAQLIADLTSIVQRLQSKGLVVDLCTITPHTSLTDVPMAYEAHRVAANAWIRNKPLGVRNVYDLADAMETARDSGVWKPGYFYTGEATRLHPNATGYDAMIPYFANIDGTAT